MKANLIQKVVSAWVVFREGSAKEAWSNAIFREQWGVFTALHDTNVSAKDVESWDMFRAYDAYPNALKMLVERGANPNVQYGNSHFDHLIQRAAVQGDIKTVEFLLKHGADLSVRCTNKYDVLGAVVNGWGESVASLERRRTMVRLLLDNGANVQSLQGQSKHSLFHNHEVDFEVTKMLLEAGAPLQWTHQHNEDEFGNTKEQDIHLFDMVFNKSPHTLMAEDVDQWLKLLKKHGALNNLTPDWNNGQPLCHVILQMTARTEEYIPVIEKHLGSLAQTSTNGDNIWHKIFAQSSVVLDKTTELFLKCDGLEELLHQPNYDGVAPRDVLRSTIENPNTNHKLLDMLEEMDNILFQRHALVEAVGGNIKTSELPKRRKM